MSVDREDELTRRIGGFVMTGAPGGWRRIDLRVSVGYAHTLSVLMDDDSVLRVKPDPEINPLLRELLELMDHGWRAMRLVIDPPGAYVVHFLHDNPADQTPEMRIAEELLFALPPGWESAQVRHDNALVHGVTGLSYAWQPPEGLVPEGSELVMKHPFSFRMTTTATS